MNAATRLSDSGVPIQQGASEGCKFFSISVEASFTLRPKSSMKHFNCHRFRSSITSEDSFQHSKGAGEDRDATDSRSISERKTCGYSIELVVAFEAVQLLQAYAHVEGSR